MATRAAMNIGKSPALDPLDPAEQLDGLPADEFMVDEQPQTKIDVNFATPPPLQFKIKQDMNTVEPLEPVTLLSSKTPFADLMLHPEKVDALLEGMIKTPTAPAPAARKKKAAARTVAKAATKAPARVADSTGGPVRKTRFSFKAGDAGSVKLAGDFTNWEKAPIEMTAMENGDWSAVISLRPGRYSYRFIVDGTWQDDPRCTRRVCNPFGTENAVIEIV